LAEIRCPENGGEKEARMTERTEDREDCVKGDGKSGRRMENNSKNKELETVD